MNQVQNACFIDLYCLNLNLKLKVSLKKTNGIELKKKEKNIAQG